MPSNAERLMSALAPVFGSGRDVVIDDPTLARMVELLRPLQTHGRIAGDDAGAMVRANCRTEVASADHAVQ